MAQKPTTQVTIYKPRITGTTGWVAVYKESKQVAKDWATYDPVNAYTTKAEADAKAATNPTRP